MFWVPSCFQVIKRCDGYISGLVNNEEELTTLLESHGRATYTSYITWSDHARETANNGRQLWHVEDYSDDVPLCVRRRMILMCQHGRAYQKKPKESSDGEQGNKKRRSRTKTVMRLDCPAKIFIRYVTRYDTFSIKGDATRSRREDAMRNLKLALTESHPPTSTFLHVKLPLVEAHRNHEIYPSMMITGYSGEGVQSIVEVESSEGVLCVEDSSCRGEGSLDILERKKIKLAQQSFRRELKRLNELSYLFEDVKSLKATSVLLRNVRRSIEGKCRKENGLNKVLHVKPLSGHTPKTKTPKKQQ